MLGEEEGQAPANLSRSTVPERFHPTFATNLKNGKAENELSFEPRLRDFPLWETSASDDLGAALSKSPVITEPRPRELRLYSSIIES